MCCDNSNTPGNSNGFNWNANTGTTGFSTNGLCANATTTSQIELTCYYGVPISVAYHQSFSVVQAKQIRYAFPKLFGYELLHSALLDLQRMRRVSDYTMHKSLAQYVDKWALRYLAGSNYWSPIDISLMQDIIYNSSYPNPEATADFEPIGCSGDACLEHLFINSYDFNWLLDLRLYRTQLVNNGSLPADPSFSDIRADDWSYNHQTASVINGDRLRQLVKMRLTQVQLQDHGFAGQVEYVKTGEDLHMVSMQQGLNSECGSGAYSGIYYRAKQNLTHVYNASTNVSDLEAATAAVGTPSAVELVTRNNYAMNILDENLFGIDDSPNTCASDIGGTSFEADPFGWHTVDNVADMKTKCQQYCINYGASKPRWVVNVTESYATNVHNNTQHAQGLISENANSPCAWQQWGYD